MAEIIVETSTWTRVDFKRVPVFFRATLVLGIYIDKYKNNNKVSSCLSIFFPLMENTQYRSSFTNLSKLIPYIQYVYIGKIQSLLYNVMTGNDGREVCSCKVTSGDYFAAYLITVTTVTTVCSTYSTFLHILLSMQMA